ncbi:S-layer homology domain-containing protein [Planococcus beigongshangi]|uniref:S-layer homology domain-containing protein n=1 Tax=Planococcus beigongshangi TaxID=2782536 RepID=UPI00193BD807|nr:S-layer homology domain-containing protein [Planococcus beigongshangi]
MTARLKIFTTLLVFTLLLASFAQSALATDDITGNTHEKEIRELAALGIMNGYGNGIYKPHADITRGQFAALLTRALNLEPAPEGISFTDLTKRSGVYNEVLAAANVGLITGYLDGSFKPDAPISRMHMAVLVKRAMVFLQMREKPATMNFEDISTLIKPYQEAISNNVAYGIFHGETINGKVYFRPLENATRGHAASVTSRLLAAALGERPAPEPPEEPEEEPEKPETPVESNLFHLGYVVDGKLVKQEYGHKDYADAASSFSSTPTAKAIIKGNDIIQIKSGVLYGDSVRNGVKQVTTVYYDTRFTQQATYIEHGRELRYISSNADYVKVQAGGTIGYVKQNEVNFVPYEMITNRDYYIKNKWGTLEHYQYNYVNKSGATHSIGPAPAEMAQGVKHYSYDGVNFSDEKGKTLFQHYPYFQYQSVRSKTSYTAEELDSFIMGRLAELNSSSGTYKDAITRSKLIGKGKYLIETQNKYNVNALFILAAAMHESAYGMSANAQNKNNLFGIKVFDSNPDAGEMYTEPEDSIEAFAVRYMNTNYANPLGLYANGAAPGNKTSGFNVKYASDPTWGSKIAGHMFRADLALGKKDINKYQLALTNTPLTNVRDQPLGNKLYQYNRTDLGINNSLGYPVIIIGEQKATDNYIWYKVISDLNPNDDKNNGVAWIRSDLLTKIN